MNGPEVQKESQTPQTDQPQAAPPQGWLGRRRWDVVAVGVLAVMTMLVFWKGFCDPADMIRGDAADLYQPYYTLAAHEVQQGRLPLWNPYILMGRPFHASLQPALLYPLRWPMFFMDYVPGFIFTICLHYFLGALAVYLLARIALKVGPLAALVAAMSIQFGGLAMGHASHPNYFLSYPWFFGTILFLWLAVQRSQWRWTIWAGVCVGLMGLVGSVHLLLVLGVLLGTFTLYYFIAALAAQLREENVRWVEVIRPPAVVAGALLLGAVIAAVQLLPAQHMTKSSARSDEGASPEAQEAKYAEMTTASASPVRTPLQMIMPYYYGDMRIGYWGEISHDEMAHYGGVAVLFAAIVGLFTVGRDRHRWFLVVLAAVGFLLGTGKFLPFYRVLFDMLPPFRQLRFPTRIWWCLDIALAFLAALGVQRMQDWSFDKKSLARLRGLTWALAAVVLIALIAGFSQLHEYAKDPQATENAVLANPEVNPHDVWTPTRIADAKLALAAIFHGDKAVWGGAAAAALTAIFFAVLVLRARPLGPAGRVVLVLLLAGDLFAMSFGMVLYSKQFWLAKGTGPEVKWLQENLGLQRYAVLQQDMRPTPDDQIVRARNLQFDIRQLAGLGGGIVESPARSQFIYGGAFRPMTAETKAGKKALVWPLMRIAGVKYLFVDRTIGIGPDELALIRQTVVKDDDPRYMICQIPDSMPMVHFVDRVLFLNPPRAADIEREGFQLMIQPDFDPHKIAVVAPRLDEPKRPPAETMDSNGVHHEVVAVHTVPGRWDIQTQSDGPGQLVISEGWDSGWRCTIDGGAKGEMSAPIFRTNDQFMSVAVPRGEHAVTLQYDPPEFRAGARYSILGILVTALLVLGVFKYGGAAAVISTTTKATKTTKSTKNKENSNR